MGPVDSNDFIFTCCPWNIFFSIYRIVFCPPAEAQSGESQASKFDLLAKIVHIFELTLLTISAKVSL